MPARRNSKQAKTVAVTGAAGYVAGRLIEGLCARDGVGRVLGFDVRPPAIRHPKLIFDELDVRDPGLRARLDGVDALVHLAFVMDPIKDESLMRDINVNGSQNVFRCAGEAGVSKVVYTSSATVYGAHPDNDVPLSEESPLRANLDFSYSAHKLEVEYVVREFRDEFADVIVTVFRPAIVLGRNVDNAWSHLMEMPFVIGVRGYSPPFQFVHEDDMAAALEFALTHEINGVFNLGPDDWMASEEILEWIGRRRIELPEPAAFSLTSRLWAMGLAEAPSGMMHYMMHPWVVSARKLADAGFECTTSTSDALAQVVPSLREHVRIGRSRVRRGDVVKAAAAGAGLIGATVGARAIRRRRSARM